MLAALIMMSASQSYAETLPLNPDVRNDTLDQTICVRGWTKTVRPATSYTNGIKRRMMFDAGIPLEMMSEYRLDHLTPLSLGGSPTDVRNLRLEETSESRDKDRVEVCLSRSVCAGRITRAQAQQAIWENWRAAGRLCSGYSVIGDE
jgi:hypothetical protein